MCRLAAHAHALDGASSEDSGPAVRDQPDWIEPAVGLTVIGQSADVPVTDKRRIGGIDWRAATDEDDAGWKAGQHLLGLVRRMNLDDVAVLEGKVWHRGKGAVAHDEHVAAREFEETLDISDIFAAVCLGRAIAAANMLPMLSVSSS